MIDEPVKRKMEVVMRSVAVVLTGLFFLAGLIFSPFANAGFDDLLKSVQKTVGGSKTQALTQSDMIDGLKEALEVGTRKAVEKVSQPNGYFKNAMIKIPLPGPIEKVEKVLRATGFGSQVDDFELSMNRAAEKAAPQATSIFIDAIKQMRFADAQKILKGRQNEATLYFKDKTEGQLQDAFQPIASDSMSKIGVTRLYQDLAKKVQAFSFAGIEGFDLDRYVTEKSVDGLFYMLAKEEANIRQNPAARVTDLLKKVFANP
jgi:hypothetical protein